MARSHMTLQPGQRARRRASHAPTDLAAHEQEGSLAPEHVEAMLELIPHAVVLVNAGGHIARVNCGFETLFGYAHDALIGKPVTVVFPQRPAAPRDHSLGGTSWLLGRRHDGSENPMSVAVTALRDGGELIVAVEPWSSAQPRLEDALAAELRQLQTITDVALAHRDLNDLVRSLLASMRDVMAMDNAAILLLSDDGHELALYQALGPEEEVAHDVRIPVGAGIAGRIAATRHPLVIEDVRGIDVNTPLIRERFRALIGVPLLVDGRLIGVVHADSIAPRRFTERNVRFLQLVAGRIALAIEGARLYKAEQEARRQSEAALAQARVSETRFRRLVESDVIGVVILEWSHIVEANDAFLRMIGYSREEFPPGGLRWRDLTPTDEMRAIERAHEQVLATGSCAPFEKHYTRRDGSRVPLLVGPVLLDRDPPRMVTFVMDLSMQKRLERERELARAREMAAVEVTHHMDEFFATAAHDLRNPVAAIQGYVQLARRHFERVLAEAGNQTPEPDDASESMRRNLRAADESVKRLVGLVELLFDVARARTGTLELRLTTVDLGAIVRVAVEEQRAAAPQRLITLQLPVAPVIAQMDAERLSQVLANYLTNALRYSADSQPVDVCLEVSPGQALVSVYDRGPGLAPEEQPRIWEKFHRAPGIEVRSGTSQSLGLGLHICRAIVELHGGQVGIESRVGQGSRFYFTLPLPSDVPT